MSDKITGDLAALVSAIFFAIYLILSERLRTSFSTITILFWTSLITSLASLIVPLIHHEQIFPGSYRIWLAMIFLSLVCYLLGQGLVIHSLKFLPSTFVSVFLLIDPILSSIESRIIFLEQISSLQLIASLAIFIGIFSVTLNLPEHAKI